MGINPEELTPDTPVLLWASQDIIPAASSLCKVYTGSFSGATLMGKRTTGPGGANNVLSSYAPCCWVHIAVS